MKFKFISTKLLLVVLFQIISMQAWSCGYPSTTISPDYARLYLQDKEIHFVTDSPEIISNARPVPIPADRDSCLTETTIRFPRKIISCDPANPTEMAACQYPNYTGKTLDVFSSTSPEWLFIENGTGRMVQIAEVLPEKQAETVASSFTNSIWYRVSVDGGITFSLLKPMIQSGYNLTNRFPGVFPGTNGMWTGASHLIQMSNGEIVVPVSYWPLDSRGLPTNTQFSNINGEDYSGVSFSVGAVLIGKWNADYSDLTWKISQTVFLPESLSTRGIVESTVAELKDRPGTLVMISRGSNELAPNIHGRRWVSKSTDYGRTWSTPIPLCYGDGTCFFSPSAASNLIRAQNGKLYWIGNISNQNPNGNLPRYPLYMAELDEESLVLVRSSLIEIDNKTTNDTESLQLAGFSTYLDHQNSSVLIYLRRFDTNDSHDERVFPLNWYRIGFAYGR